MSEDQSHLSLLFRVGSRRCAIPLARVVETMRPLAAMPLPRCPAWIGGLAMVRGHPTPVVDVARLLGVQQDAPSRWVTLTTGNGTMAMAVGEVEGVMALALDAAAPLAPLLKGVAADVIEAVAVLNAELLLLLNHAHWVPEDVWAQRASEVTPT